jgi:hypothetical protein
MRELEDIMLEAEQHLSRASIEMAYAAMDLKFHASECQDRVGTRLHSLSSEILAQHKLVSSLANLLQDIGAHLVALRAAEIAAQNMAVQPLQAQAH